MITGKKQKDHIFHISSRVIGDLTLNFLLHEIAPRGPQSMGFAGNLS